MPETEVMSIFQLISYEMGEGTVLPEDFSLPENRDVSVVGSDESLSFANGAMDGIYEYHTAHTPLEEETKDRLWQLLDRISDTDSEEMDEAINDFCTNYRAIMLIDDIQNYLLENANKVNPDAVYNLARNLMMMSSYTESVKVGMILMELFDIEEDIAIVANILGRCDEFTLFAIFLLRKYENGQEMIMEMGSDVSGWGRIHCVDFIEPESDEIREWLLTDGVANDIKGAYSAYTVYEKADIEAYLEDEELTVEQFEGILNVTVELLDEGPVLGISAIEDSLGYIKRVLAKAGRMGRLKENDYRGIVLIDWWLEENELGDAECDELFDIIFADEYANEVYETVMKEADSE